MNSLQKSIWSSDELSNIHPRQSLIEDFKKNNDNHQVSINAWSDEVLEDGEDNSKKLSSPYWFCCQCCIVGSLLTSIILAIVLTLWLKNPTATSLTSSTIISDMSTISTTITTTTESTTTTTATVAFPTLPCSISNSVSANILLTLTNSNFNYNTYMCYAFSWTSSVTGTVNLNFQFRHSASSWNLDDVSVYRGATQMLANGNFETGSLSPWTRATPVPSNCAGNSGAQVTTPSRLNGNYHLQDGCKGNIDKVSQQFSAIAGETYVVSFWLQTDSTASSTLANVSIT